MTVKLIIHLLLACWLGVFISRKFNIDESSFTQGLRMFLITMLILITASVLGLVFGTGLRHLIS